MKVLSIDVGIKNLGMCIFDSDNERILYWDVREITSGYVQCRHVKKFFDDLLEIHSVDEVIIEKQPNRNVRMRVIETMIHMYMTMKNMKSIAYSSKHKLFGQGGNLKGKKNYNERKKRSISIVMLLVRGTKHESYFNMSRKKDDLADSYLQVLSYLNIKIPEVRYNEKTKYSSRKPSKKQERYGFSKSNIKYYLQNCTEEECNESNMFTKAIQSYYNGNIENARIELL